MSIILGINVAIVKWFWWELDRKLDLIKNLNDYAYATKGELVVPIAHLSDELKTTK